MLFYYLEKKSDNSDDGKDGGEGDRTSRASKSVRRSDGSGVKAFAGTSVTGTGFGSASATDVGFVGFGVEDSSSGVALGDLEVVVLVGTSVVVAEARTDRAEVVSDGVARTRRSTVVIATIDAEGVGVNSQGGDDSDEDSNEGDEGGRAHFLIYKEKDLGY